MMSPEYMVMLVVDLASLLVVLPGHLGILMMYFHNLINYKAPDIKDQLFCGLSICNLLNGLSRVVQDFFLILDENPIVMFYNFGFMLIRLSTMPCILFFSTWLSVHFCLKIVNLNKRWYIYLQRRFAKIFPWLLLFSVCVSILCSFPYAFFASKFLAEKITVLSSYGNRTVYPVPSRLLTSVQCYIILSSLWFILFLSSSCPIIVSLYQHMRRFQVSTTGSTFPTLQPHITAVITITLLMILNALYFFSLILFIHSADKLIVNCVTLAIFNICHIASIAILLRGNHKVRETMARWLRFCGLKCNIQSQI
ncbi:hypothetical protein GDO81_014923 [Engystomops pustulosus]|uniref:Taste receptor type 2 n=1 Tax=Engystomops pustulosus TaxID=76066 RepID=A0AAV7AFK8_ENGPU|nr:hypothetical protein GDO81_014923 [Engystomops pustulosus]